MRHWELQELAAFACGLTEEQWEAMQNEDRESELDDLIYEKFFESDEDPFTVFSKIAEELLKLTPKVQSGLTLEIFNAFVVGNRCILKGEKEKVSNNE